MVLMIPQLRARIGVEGNDVAIDRGLSGFLCARHNMTNQRSMYAKAGKEDAEEQRDRASADIAEDTSGIA